MKSTVLGPIGLCLAALVMPAGAQVEDRASALEQLFGGKVVIGKAPELMAEALPTLEGVEFVVAHVREDSFTAILESERDVGSVVSEYGRLLGAAGWRRTSMRLGNEDTALNLCAPNDSLLRIWPMRLTGRPRAKVELQRRSGLCSIRKAWSRSVPENPARNLVDEFTLPASCKRPSGGGRGGAGFHSWNTILSCGGSVKDVEESMRLAALARGWRLMLSKRDQGWALSAWEREDAERGEHFVALTAVRSSQSSGTDVERLVWTVGGASQAH